MYWQDVDRTALGNVRSIGLRRDGSDVLFDLNANNPHCLDVGASGSGKTELLKSIVVSVASRYNPNEVELLLIDPKNHLHDFNNLAHLTYPIETGLNNPKYMEYVQLTYNEMARRIELSESDRAKLTPWYLMIDEGGELDRVALGLLVKILSLGRSERVHIVFSTQNPSQSQFKDILFNMSTKFVGQVNAVTDSYRCLGRGKGFAHELAGEGDFLSSGSGEIDHFQVAMATKVNYDSLPRAELKDAPVVEIKPVQDVKPLPMPINEQSSRGRPAKCITPEILGHLWFYGPDRFNDEYFKTHWDVGRDKAASFRTFVKEFGAVYKQLRKRGLQHVK